jgi:surface antigen
MKIMVPMQKGAPKFGSLALLIITGFFGWGLAALGQTPAAITNPTDHATLSNPSVTFDWTVGTGASDYFLYVGTTQGANNVFAKDEGLAASQVVNGLPNGTIWVRLWTLIGSTWWINDYSYTEIVGTSPATMTVPANHATLSNPTVTLNWTTGSGASDYFLYVGTTQGANNILGKDEGLATSQGINGLPNGTIWVRLWTLIGSTWWINDYSYTENGGSGTPAVITSPANHSDVFGGSITLQWATGNGASDYFLYVGTSQGANNILGKDEGLATSQVVNGLPNGTIWVRVWTLIGSTWWANDYSYTDFLVGDDYPWKSTPADSVNSYTDFYIRECTDFVAWRMNRDKGDTSPSAFWFKNTIPGQNGIWGNAINWMSHAQAVGYRVDTTPAIGAVAYFSASPGHVAYVESLNADGSVNLSEYNYDNPFAYGIRYNVTTVTAFIHVLH